MTADYKSHGHRPQKRSLPGFVWLLIGLGIGLFVALIVYLDKQPVNDVSFADAIERDLEKLRAPQQQQAPAAVKAPVSDEGPSLKYTYHTILKELEVLIPTDELRIGGSDEPTAVAPIDDRQYLLQAGSFKQPEDAERLKAKLALLGMQANIESVSIQGARWYRVRLGPYQDSKTAYRELNTLRSNGITAMAFSLK